MKKFLKPIRMMLLLLITCAIATSMFGCGDIPTVVGNSGSSQPDNPPAATKDPIFKVGDMVELGDTVVTLLSVKENKGSKYNKPEKGNVFLLCEFEIKNNSSEELNISSLLCFDAYCDDYACSMSLTAMIEKGDAAQLDGTIAPGKKMKGVIGYEVSKEWKELEIHYTPDAFSSKDITFIATND